MRSMLVEDILTPFAKVFLMGTYVPWALKTILLDPPKPNYLFGVVILVLSIYGLWILMLRVSRLAGRTVDDRSA